MRTSSTRRRLWAKLAWLHRWLGVAACLSFLVWFSSGMVMLFVPFPALPDAARRAGSEPLQLSRLHVSPAAALQAGGGADTLRLIAVSGQPRYVLGQGQRSVCIDGEHGRVLGQLNAAAATATATRFSGIPVRLLEGPVQIDQWSVHPRFDAWRPFYRAHLADAAGSVLYVSARTGEVVQRTRSRERAWNWVGAVPHWLYFTALRQHADAWDRSVWWLALTGLAGAISGTVLGVYRTARRRAQRQPGWSPFRGLLRWHHGLGLGAAAVVLVWMFSGWLSMDHGRLFSRGQPAPAALQRYTAASLQQALAGVAPVTLSALDGSSEIGFSVVAGQAWASGRGGERGNATLLLDPATGSVQRLSAQARRTRIMAAAASAWPLALGADAAKAPASDGFYRDADAIPASALRVPLQRPQAAALYVDLDSGQPLLQLDASRKAYAWLYLALHTTHVPGLTEHPRLRLAVQLLLLAIGWCLSATGVILGVRRLRASLPRPRRARPRSMAIAPG